MENVNQYVHLQGTITQHSLLYRHTPYTIFKLFFLQSHKTVLVATLKSATFRLSCAGFMTDTKSPLKATMYLCECTVLLLATDSLED